VSTWEKVAAVATAVGGVGAAIGGLDRGGERAAALHSELAEAPNFTSTRSERLSSPVALDHLQPAGDEVADGN